MRPPASESENRTHGAKKIGPSQYSDFFNRIGQKRTRRLQFVMSAPPPKAAHCLRGYGIHYPGSAVVQDNENHLPRAPPTAELRRLKFPCSSSEFPCYALGISLFRSAGNFALAR
jgi:hypothetical protein